jgi:hypothetical protein
LREFDESFLRKLETKYKAIVKNLDDYLGLLDSVFDKLKKEGTIALKDNSGYFSD